MVCHSHYLKLTWFRQVAENVGCVLTLNIRVCTVVEKQFGNVQNLTQWHVLVPMILIHTGDPLQSGAILAT